MEKQEQEKQEKLRIRILEKLDDLKEKIETNEDLPEGKQDISLLIDIGDNIDDCLNAWYY